MGRLKQYHILLNESDIQKLNSIIRSQKASKTIIHRCQILLELDENNSSGLTYRQIAKTFGVSPATISNIVSDYMGNGLDKTVTYKRNPNSNARSKMDGRCEARIIELACSAPPQGYSRWTLRLLAEKSKIVLDTPVSKNTIQNVLKKQNFSLTETITGASRRKKMPPL